MTTSRAAAAVLLHDLSLDDLRILRQRLTDEEGRVSYWRRLFQARLDMLADTGPVDTHDVRAVLQDASQAPRRWQALGLHPAEIDTAMPEAQSLWAQVIDTQDEDQRQAYVAVLRSMEISLSKNRRALHRQIDAVTEELVARYRTNPALALTALPKRRHA
ncbi:MAG: hypothetical protein R2720_01190 [Candidatus Nanopelagicales bacterium]